MSTTIDQKVVEMRFDNKNFENNVKDTMSTLDKFKQKLNLTGASKGLENINNIANKITFGGITGAIDSVRTSFSALEVIGVTALANITNSAVNAGARIASALTIDPIKTGFQEYETQINAVQTILANTESKGSTLQDVNRALDELNTYADKTIYNFTEMTRNIGTFTAAGVDLDTSVSAIQGIANLAAVSGSTSQQASTAMYQLSQALSSGTVKLMDWNSVVNAGMGGQVFQDALKDTARAHGVAIDKIIKKQGSFRESLSEGWLTSEILTDTLKKFTMAAEEGSEQWNEYKKSLIKEGYTEKQAESILKMANTATEAATKVKTFTQLFDTLKESAQSGWTQTWEIIVGDFGEAKEFLTTISDTVGGMLSASADARNKLLSGGLSSGWKQLLGAGIADEEGYKETLINVSKESGFAFDELIKETEKKGGDFDDALKQALSDKKISADTLSKSVFKLSEKMQGMSAEERKAAGYTAEHIEEIKKLEKGLKDGSVSMEEFTKKIMRSSGRENLIEALTNSFKALMNIVNPIKEAFRDIFPKMESEALYNITVRIKEMTASFREFTEKYGPQLKSTFKGLFSVLDIGVTFIKEVAGGIARLLGNFTGLISGILTGTASLGDYLSNVRDSVKESNIFGKAIDGIVNFLQKGIDAIKEFAKYVGQKFAMPGYEGLFGVLKAIWDMVIKVGSSIGKVLSETLRSGDIVAAIDVFNTGLLSGLLIGVNKFVSNLSGSFKGIREILEGLGDILESYQQNLQAKTLLKIASAIGILAASLLLLASIKPDKLNQAIGAMTVLFIELLGALKVFGMISKDVKNVIRASTGLIALSNALLVLAIAMKIMSTMSWSEMGVGLISITVGLFALVKAVNSLPESKVLKASKAIKKLSSALLIFAVAMKIMSTMSLAETAIALGALTIGLFAMVKAVNKLPEKKVAGLIGLATSLVILGGALKIMASMSWKELALGLGSIAIGLTAMVVAMNKLPNKMIGKSAGMIGLASSLVILGGALKIMASMNLKEIAIALGATIVSLAAMVVAMNTMSDNGIIRKSLAMITMASSLVLLGGALKIIGSMSLASIGKALLGIAGVFVIIGIAGHALAPLIPTLLGLAGAFALFGVSTLAIGVGLGLIAAGITALALAVSTGATAIVAGLTAIILGIIGLVPEIVKVIGDCIVILCKVLIECAPLIANTILIVISEIFKSLATYTPMIVNSLFDFLIGILNVLRDRMPELIVAVMEVIGALFKGVIDALKTVDTATLLQGAVALTIITGLIYMLSGIAGLIPGAMLGVLGLGVIIAELGLVLAAIGGLAQIPGLTWLVEQGGNFLQAVGTAIGQFIGGIVGGIAKGITGSLPQIGTDLSEFMKNIQPFIEGAKLIDPSIIKNVAALAGAIILITAADVYSGIATFLTGGNSLSEFGEQLVPLGESMVEYSNVVKDIDSDAVTASATAAKALAELANNLPNSGGIAGWFAGNNDMSTFGDELVSFGKSMTKYSDSVKDIDTEAVTASATAAKALSELANGLPNSGGIAGWFAGNNDMSTFGHELVSFGKSMTKYSDSVKDIDTEAVTASAIAAEALSELANGLPNSGGMVSWFTGDNDISTFGEHLVPFGEGMSEYSKAIDGINTEAVTASAVAAESLSKLANGLPNSGGLVAWFTGDNDMGTFGVQLALFGAGLKSYSDSIDGINPETVVASATAAESLVALANNLPNLGGLVSFFTGDQSLATFGIQLALFGKGLKSYSDSIDGINPDTVVASANAAKSLAALASDLPNLGGVISFFTGDQNLAVFGSQLGDLGAGLRNFVDKIGEFTPEQTSAVDCAGKAVQALATAANTLPSDGGVWQKLFGSKSLATFGSQLGDLGTNLKKFISNIGTFGPDQIATVDCAGKAVQALATAASQISADTSIWDRIFGDKSLTNFGEQLGSLGTNLNKFIGNIGTFGPDQVATVDCAGRAVQALASAASLISADTSIWERIFGDNSLTKFGQKLGPLGTHLSQFVGSIGTFGPEQVTTIDCAAKAIQSLGESAGKISADTSVWERIFGDNSLTKFGDKLPDLGKALSGFAWSLGTFGPDQINTIKAATEALQAIAALGGTDLDSAGKNLETYGARLISFANKTTEFIKSMGSYSIEDAQAAVDKIKGFTELVTTISNIDTSIIETFGNSLNDLATKGFNKFIEAFNGEGPKDKAVKAMTELMNSIINGAESKTEDVETAFGKVSSAGIKALNTESLKASAKQAGKDLVKGFAMGITNNSYLATDAASALGRKALQAAKRAIDSNSPSKEAMKIGNDFDNGLMIGIKDFAGKVYDTAYNVGDRAKTGLSNAISKVSDLVNNGIDDQLTIRPVLDLSDIKSGVGAINGIFNNGPSIGVTSNLRAISSGMNSRNQNGSNDDVVSAINKLRGELGNVGGDTYNVNGVTYDDGSNITDAVKTLVRAAKVGRRT